MKKIILSGAALLAAGTAPVIPENLEFRYAYQTTPETIAAEVKRIELLRKNATTSVYTAPEPPVSFEDDDGNGLISIAAFTDQKGRTVYIRIPDSQYADMGEPTGVGKGASRNPTRTEFRTVLESALRHYE